MTSHSQHSANLFLHARFNDLAIHDRVERLSLSFSTQDCDQRSKPIIADRANTTSYIGKDPLQDAGQDRQELCASVAASGRVSSDKQLSPDTWSGDEQHFQCAALPLMLLKPKIQESLHLLTCHAPGVAQLSADDANWIRDELEGLLALCHESSAASLRRLPSGTVPCSKPSGKNSAAAVQGNVWEGCQRGKRKETLATQFFLRESAAGKVSVRAQCVRDVETGATAVSDIVLLLAPKPAIHGDGILISLSRLTDKFHQPLIHRSISSYAVVEANSPIFECVRSNNIGHLRELLKTRQATPDIRNTENESLLSVWISAPHP